jgi:hypothetical protein
MPDYELFIATEDVARAGGSAVKTERLPEIRRGRLGPDPDPKSDRIPSWDDTALGELWEVLGGAAPAEVIDGENGVYGDGLEEGPWVYRLPQDLVDRLAALTPDQIRSVADGWAKRETFRDYKPTLEPEPIIATLGRLFRPNKEEAQRRHQDAKVRDLEEILTSMVRLVQRAKQSSKGVYLYCEL